MKKLNPWTRRERQLLKELYNKVPMEILMEKLNRSYYSITSQVAYLRKRGWSFKEKRDIE